MKNSQLIDIMCALDRREKRELRQWLISPAHNQRTDVVDLYDYLMAGRHLSEDKFLEKERVFRKLFPGEDYDDARMRQVIHFTLKATEEFLGYREFVAYPTRQRLSLLTAYRKRRLSRLFDRSLRKARQSQKRQTYRDEQYLRYDYLLEKEQFNHTEEAQRTVEKNLQAVSYSQDAAYIADRLRLACVMVSHQTVYKTTYDTGLLSPILDYLENHPKLLFHPAIAIYYYGYLATTDREESAHFERLRDEIERSETHFPPSEMRDIYLMAINYCIAKINANVKPFIREAYALYKRGFERGFLIKDNQISQWSFLNVVSNALQLKEFDWAENFIEDYSTYLPEDHRHNFYNYSRARLLFARKDYEAAMPLLMQVEYNDILVNLMGKTLLMKMFFEQGEYDALESLLSSMRVYLRRKEVMSYHKQLFKNTIHLTQRLMRVNPYDKAERAALQREIEATNPLTERDWLIAQVREM